MKEKNVASIVSIVSNEQCVEQNIKQNVETLIETLIDALFEELITHQRMKVLGLARDKIPHLTGDDILNPHDYPELCADPVFNYEEGFAAGLLAAQIAVRARVFRERR